MAELLIRSGPRCIRVQAEPGTPLSHVLMQTDIAVQQPCGGRGVCGKCAVMLDGAFSAPNAHECRAGVRLACQAVIEGDGEVILPRQAEMTQIESGSALVFAPLNPLPGLMGAAADIGTTTLALRLFDLRSGQCIGISTMLNPQTSVAADVIGRMDAAMKGQLTRQQQMIVSALETMLAHAASQCGADPAQVGSLCITGNTTMLYLLCGRDPVSLSRAPFRADHLFGEPVSLMGREAYLPPCLHAFVGADTTCAILASGMCRSDETALLCDVGTNGEIALWRNGRLYVASTAAGPAFEGAGISCGCGSIPGAIDRVDIVNGQLHSRTIGGGKAAGLCGSGLISLIAGLLDLEMLDETGTLEEDEITLAPGVSLTQADVRAVQLAKAAIAAGIGCLMEKAGCRAEDIRTLYLAGGFGSHLSIPHAVRIGLIPPQLQGRVKVIGNAALDGAALLLTDQSRTGEAQRLAGSALHVDLGGSAAFSSRYVEEMFFPEI